MGAGTERAQKAALADFVRYESAVKAAAADGVSMLFAGTSMELLGRSITDDSGKEYAGIGLAGFTSVQGKKRFVEDVYGATDLYPEAVVGFVNKCSTISGVECSLLNAVQLGYGNEGLKTPEGFRYKNVIGSHLTGPILVKNPRLLDAVVAAIYEKRGVALPAELPVNRWTEDGYTITAEALKQRI
jgi:CobQ-like glutamine amidotransferase family enzyme